MTKNYDVHFIVSKFTKALILDFIYRELDNVRVNGKEMAKKWQLRFLSQFVKRLEWVKRHKDSLKLFCEALKLYCSQNWNLAKMQLNNLQIQETQRSVYD